MNAKLGLTLFLALMAFDGAVRKWVLPQSEQLVYIAKDVLLLALLSWHLMRRGFQLPPGISTQQFQAWLGLYALVAGLQAFNPSLPTLVLGLFGLKTHLLYAALVVLVPASFPGTEQLARWLRLLLLPAILVLTLGVLQFYLPADHVLNRYVRGTFQDIATFGLARRVRVTSTFSYISGMTVFIYFAMCLGLALLAAGRWKLRGNVLAYACIVVAAMVTPMTGARWIYYMVMATVPIFLISMLRVGMLQTRFALRIVVLACLGVAAVSLWSLEAFESLEYRRQSSLDAAERLEGLLQDPWDYALEAGFLGFGAGATHQAAPALVPGAGFYSWLPVRDFEDEPARIMLELGVVGFVAAFALRLYLCWLAWRALAAGATRTEKGLAGGALMFFVAHLVSPIVFNPTGGALYWLFAGILATILRDQHLRRAAAPALPPGAALVRAA